VEEARKVKTARGLEPTEAREGERPREPHFPEMFGLARTLALPRTVQKLGSRPVAGLGMKIAIICDPVIFSGLG